MATKRLLYRDVENGKVSGVCAGLSDYFDIDVTLIRVIWLVFILCMGSGLIAYIIMAIIVEPKSVVMRKDQEKTVNNDDPFSKYDK